MAPSAIYFDLMKRAPGPGLLQFMKGLRTRGFLDFVGEQWREHGDAFQVKLGPRTLFFAMHPDSVERVSVSQKQTYEKLKSYDGVRDLLIGDGLVVSVGELWRRQRKLMAPFYTPKGVQQYAELFLRDGNRLAERWQTYASKGEEVEISEEMTFVTATIILKAMFSFETNESIVQMRDAVDTLLQFVSERLTSVPVPTWLPTAKNRKFNAANKLVNELIKDIISKRKALDEAQWPDDLLSKLMKAKDEETGHVMSDQLLRDESITTFFAGHETTARTMTFAWYALATNPNVRERLNDELDRVLGGAPPTVEALKQLPYTLQVVKEVLRLYPPAPFYARDAAAQGELGGFEVPKGATVMLSPYFTHRHPDFWENPDVFEPERWTKEKEQARHGYAYHPFAAGQRICIGNNFALLEAHLLLAILAQRFTPRLRPGYEACWQMHGTLHLRDGLPMVIEARS